MRNWCVRSLVNPIWFCSFQRRLLIETRHFVHLVSLLSSTHKRTKEAKCWKAQGASCTVAIIYLLFACHSFGWRNNNPKLSSSQEKEEEEAVCRSISVQRLILSNESKLRRTKAKEKKVARQSKIELFIGFRRAELEATTTTTNDNNKSGGLLGSRAKFHLFAKGKLLLLLLLLYLETLFFSFFGKRVVIVSSRLSVLFSLEREQRQPGEEEEVAVKWHLSLSAWPGPRNWPLARRSANIDELWRSESEWKRTKNKSCSSS